MRPRIEEPHRHLVDFYSSDAEIAARVGSHLAEGLGNGEVVIAVAATARLNAIVAAMLDSTAVNLESEKEASSLVTLDAAETLEQLVSGGRVDRRRFDMVIGSLVRSATSGGRRARVYGEMVQLLWERGEVNAAIELEMLWNELGRQLDFSLYCSYRAESVSGAEDALAAIFELHSEVAAGARPVRRSAWTALGEFPVDVDAPAAARHFAVEVAARHGFQQVADEVALIVTELSANSVRHARSPFRLEMSASAAGLRISVQDQSPIVPTPRSALVNQEAGRGLTIVAALATGWGCDFWAGGKEVWAELSQRPFAIAPRAGMYVDQ